VGPAAHDGSAHLTTLNITIDKTRGEPLGIRLDTKTMVVKSLLPGLIQSWNDVHEEQQVRPGDRIVEVNGFCGDVELLHQKCRERCVLHITLRRMNIAFGLMQFRSLGPEDFRLLSLLDEESGGVGAPSPQQAIVDALPHVPANVLPASARECAICLSEYEPEAVVAQLPCSHAYCCSCIEEWLLKGNSECPLCLAPLVAIPDTAGRTGAQACPPPPPPLGTLPLPAREQCEEESFDIPTATPVKAAKVPTMSFFAGRMGDIEQRFKESATPAR